MGECTSCREQAETVSGLCVQCRVKYDSLVKSRERPEDAFDFVPVQVHKPVELPPRDENILVDSIVNAFKLLLTTHESNSKINVIESQRILSKIESIVSIQSTLQTFAYFCVNGAATSKILQYELEFPQATVFRTLSHLKAMKVIFPAIKTFKVKGSKGGPRSTVWALKETPTEEVARAIRLHNNYQSPKFQVAEKAAQTILEEYLGKRRIEEITYREIVIHIKEMSIPFRTPDIADLAAIYLTEKGMKVWR